MTALPQSLGSVIVLSILLGAACCAAPTNLATTVSPRPSYPGKLRASEVCMRSLSPRPLNASDPHDTLKAIRDFHVTRLEWTYGLTPAFIAKAKALGCTVSGASAAMSVAGVDTKIPEWYRAYSVLDLNGEPVEAPWMRAWAGHTLWGCINNPKMRAGFLAYVKNLVDMGVADIQRDDPADNFASVNWGACFCPYCVAGFRDTLRATGDPAELQAAGVTDLDTFDYAAYLRQRNAPVGDAFAKYPQDYLKRQFISFQEQSTINFHRWWRGELNRLAGRYIPVSANNGVDNFSPIYQVFDFFMGELNYDKAQPETLHETMSRALELGKGLTVTMPLQSQPDMNPQWLATTRRTIATVYALGMHIEAPWDTYLPILGPTPARMFGNPPDYADLFALVRAHPELLDGYEEAAVAGGALDETQPAPVTVWAEEPQVYAFTRVQPGQPDAPIVVHLINWSNLQQPFNVSLNPQALFAGRPVSVSLVTPKPYDQALHHQAFDTRDYSALSQTTPLAEGAVTTCEVPPLQPWGMLVIKPLPAKAALWPPRFVPTDLNGTDAVTIVPPATGVTVRYTTDGTAPTSKSPAFTRPLPLAGLKTLRARSFTPTASSTVAALSHFPNAGSGWTNLLTNADFSQGTTGWRTVTTSGKVDFTTGPVPALGGVTAARLQIAAADGVPYNLRLTQPVNVPTGAQVYLRTTLAASQPTRIRLGVQEVNPPHRVIGGRVLEIGPTPQRVLLTPVNEHPDLQAQFQLDLGYAAAGTTVWLGPVQLRTRPTSESR